MSIYTPAVPTGVIQNSILNVPFLFRDHDYATGTPPAANSNYDFTQNRFDIDNAAGNFPGQSDFVSWATDSVFALEEWSIAAWVMPLVEDLTSDSPVAGVLSDGTFPFNLNFGLITADMVPGVFIAAGGQVFFAFAFEAIEPGTWHHYAGTFDGSTLRFYHNGLLRQETPVTGSIAYNSPYFVIGNDGAIPFPSNAAISDVSLFDFPLSLSQVVELMNTTWLQKGSRRGSVLQKSGKSYSIRRRTKPMSTRTAKTSRSRSAFTSTRSNSRLLTPAQIAAYEADAPAFPRVNSLGREYVLRPRELFTAQGVPLAIANQPLNFTSQPPVEGPDIGSIGFSPDASGESFLFSFGIQLVPEDFIFFYAMSAASAVSRSSISEYQLVTLLQRNPGETCNQNVFTQWVARFGSTENVTGMSVAMEWRALHIPSGQIPSRTSVITDFF